jgi:hypothetical protein
MKTAILDERVNEYIRECLLRGSIVAEKTAAIDLGRGVTFAYLPDRVSEEATQFKTGGLFDLGEAREAEERVAAEIASYLNEGTDRCVIFDDRVHDPGGRFIEHAFYFHCQGQVFLYADRYISSKATEIKALMRVANPWPFVALLTRWTQKPDFTRGSEISVSDVMQLAENIEGVIVNAWDDEGYLIWRKQVDKVTAL